MTVRMDARAVDRFADLINAFGEARYGDEWWPGNPHGWLDHSGAARLDRYCSNITPVVGEKAAAGIVGLFEEYGRVKFGSGRFGPAFDVTEVREVLGRRRGDRLLAISARARETRAAA